MPYPKKFKDRLEIELKDVEAPNYLWLTYGVCGCQNDSCGWEGWIIEAAYKKTVEKYSSGTGDKPLSCSNNQRCPSCNEELFRTDATVRFVPSTNQIPVHGIPGKDYEVEPIEYED